jgi:hypothetical protein
MEVVPTRSDLEAYAPQRRQQLLLDGVEDTTRRRQLVLESAATPEVEDPATPKAAGGLQAAETLKQTIDGRLHGRTRCKGLADFPYRPKHISFDVAGREATREVLNGPKRAFDSWEFLIRHYAFTVGIQRVRGPVAIKSRWPSGPFDTTTSLSAGVARDAMLFRPPLGCPRGELGSPPAQKHEPDRGSHETDHQQQDNARRHRRGRLEHRDEPNGHPERNNLSRLERHDAFFLHRTYQHRSSAGCSQQYRYAGLSATTGLNTSTFRCTFVSRATPWRD